MKRQVSFILSVFILTSCVQKEKCIKVEDTFTPLEAGAVQLDGFLDGYIRHSITHWNKGVVPYAEFVDFFRQGRPQFALGEMWGKAVRSGCMFYRYTQDAELKRILEATVKDMLTTQQSNGSISCVSIDRQPDSSGGDLWERKYVMLGMEEFYEWVNPDPKVLESLTKQADCIIAQVGNPPKTSILEQGWSATGIESSTLLEPFMRLYRMTGEQRYLDFATYIVEAGGSKGSNLFQQAYDNVEPRNMGLPYPKAYEMTSVFEGLVEYYRVTGDLRLKQSALNYFKNVKEKEITLVGNGGGHGIGGEGWNNMAFEQSDPDIQRMMETCVGVTWMKYCSHLLRLTGDVSTVDEIEKYVYNGLIGAMKPTGDGFSYVNLLNGCKVNDHGWGWTFDDVHVTCCNLNGPMGLAYIPYVAVMNTPSGPVVNLYQSGTMTAQTPSGHPVKLILTGDYPLTGEVALRVEPKKTESFAIRLRIPSWSQTTVLKINGEEQQVKPGAYFEISRKWRAGDLVTIVFDMRCRVIPAPHGSNRAGDNRVALIRGPIVLARDQNSDEHFDQPVNIASHDGYVELISEQPANGARLQYRAPLTDGRTIQVTDYASIDNWDGSHVCTWIPLER